MKITIDFDPNNPEDLAIVQSIVGGGGVTAHEASADVEAETTRSEDTKEADEAEAKKKAAAEKRKKAAAEKKAKEEAEAKAKEEAEAAAAAEEEEKSDEPEFTREDVKAKLKDYAALEGKEAAIGILKDHGAASITELAEDKYADVIAACGD